jgi:hypothetical protein
MKIPLIIILCLSFTIYARRIIYCIRYPCPGWPETSARRTQQAELTEGAIVAFESGNARNLYLAADGRGCLDIQHGRCGSLYGYKDIEQTIDTNTLIEQSKELQWTVLKYQDFYCFRSVMFKAFFTLDASDCRENMITPCGSTYLFKTTNECAKLYGWRIRMVGNSYVLQSVQFNNVFLYLNGESCLSLEGTSMHISLSWCGSAVGLYLKNIENLRPNNVNKWVFYNIPYQILPQTGSNH